MSDPTNSIFSTPDAPAPVVSVPQDDALATLLGSIQNERGEAKYKDVASALTGLKNAQEFIPTLQRDLAAKDAAMKELQAKADRAAELERVIASLTSGTPPVANPVVEPKPDTVDVASLIEKALSQRETQQAAKTNIGVVLTAVSAAFGDKAETVFYGKAAEMGMSVPEFNALAAKSPKAVLQMLGVNSTPAPRNPSAPLNSTPFVPTTDTQIKKNTLKKEFGNTSADNIAEVQAAKQMVEELHASGRTIQDLTNPKVFFKHFR